MKLLYRYVFRELFAPFFFGVAAFTGIFIGTDLLFEMTRYYTKWGVDLLTLLQLFFLSLPEIIVICFPMATLLATILGYSRLSGDSEVTAFRAGGISINSLVVPALVIGLLMSLVAVGINEYVVPRANYRYNQISHRARTGETMPRTQDNLFITQTESGGGPDYMLYSSHFNGETGEMSDVVLQDFRDGEASLLIEAEKAVWDEDEWYFYRGKLFRLQEGERIPSLEFEEYVVRTVVYGPEEMERLSKDVDDMTLGELSEHIEMLREQGKTVNEELVDWHQRLAIPFASFIFALLAAPLGIRPRRSGGTAFGMGLSIIVIFIYYTVMTIGDAFGGQGTIAPWLGAWGQNIVFLFVGGIMLYRVGR
ncbi:MAG: LptF/LptG family permease [Bacillota bacterium]